MTTPFEFDVQVIDENRHVITKEIQAIQIGAKHFTIDVDTVFDAVVTIGGKLQSVPPDSLVGSSVLVDYHARVLQSKDERLPSSTQFNLEYKQDGWHLVNIRRAPLSQKAHKVLLSDKANQAIMDSWQK